MGDALNDFEAVDETLLTYNETGGSSLWEKGVPEGSLLNEAASGTEAPAMTRYLDGNYPDNSRSFLVSNCYEFSSIRADTLFLKWPMTSKKISMWSMFSILPMRVRVGRYSENINSEPNWYTSDRTNASSGTDDDCQQCPGAQWTGTNATLTEYSYDFTANANLGETDLTSEDSIVFRITFVSDQLRTRKDL